VTAGRIVIFVPAIHAFGGVERQILELSRFLCATGRTHTVLCFSCSIDLAAHAQWPMAVQSLDPPRNPFAEARSLARYFREDASGDIEAPLFFDLKGAFYAGLAATRHFHLHLTDPPSLLPRDVSKHAFSLRNRCFEKAAPAAGWLGMLRGEVVHRINKRGVNLARSVIATTNAIADEIEALYGRRATVVRPGITMSPTVRRATHAKSGMIRFLSVSRLESSKRIDWMLNALAALEQSDRPLSRRRPWALDIVGDGPEAAHLRELASRLGLTDRVVFHGHVSDEMLDGLFTQAGLFLMPAIQGYGLPALESLARGTPVILHRQSGVSEILNQPPWVESIVEGPEELARAIERMIGNIDSGLLERQPKPVVPNATEWARQIAAVCEWA